VSSILPNTVYRQSNAPTKQVTKEDSHLKHKNIDTAKANETTYPRLVTFDNRRSGNEVDPAAQHIHASEDYTVCVTVGSETRTIQKLYTSYSVTCHPRVYLRTE